MTKTFQEFLEYEKDHAEKAAIEVASDPIIFASIKNWNKLHTEQKISFAERYSRLCAQVLETNLVGFETFEAPKRKNGLYISASHGKDILGSGVIRLNVHPDIFSEMTVEEISDIPPHELAHQKQKEVISTISKLPPEFREEIPPIFDENFKNYKGLENGYFAYRNQPVEQHAFTVGETFSKALIGWINARKFLINPYDEAIVKEEFEGLVGARSGGIHLSNINGIETANPYQHYYAALLHEKRLAQPLSGHVSDTKWLSAIKHYKKSIECAEFLAHDPIPALEALGRFASNQVYDDSRAIPRQIQVPGRIQMLALSYLQEFVNSNKSSIRVTARREISKAGKGGMQSLHVVTMEKKVDGSQSVLQL